MARALFAGIDVSALSCQLACLHEQGHELGPARSFANDLEGASALAQALDSLARIQALHIGLEATSVYGVHLREFLLQALELKPYSPRVYEINPLLLAGFRKAFGAKRPKTDALHAYAIAERVRFGHLRPYTRPAAVTEPLDQLTRLRLHLVEMVAAEQNRALNLLFLLAAWFLMEL